eukprot:643515_1
MTRNNVYSRIDVAYLVYQLHIGVPTVYTQTFMVYSILEVSTVMKYIIYQESIFSYVTQNNDHKWNSVARMSDETMYPSATFVSDDRLFVCGGKCNELAVDTTQILDLNDNTWTNLRDCEYTREAAGIFHQKELDRVYVAGGDDTLSKVEFYDMNKQRWYHVVNTNFCYGNYPAMWSPQYHNQNVLCIAGILDNSMERLDLRAGTKWDVVCNKELGKQA